jgi:hypothetical protein
MLDFGRRLAGEHRISNIKHRPFDLLDFAGYAADTSCIDGPACAHPLSFHKRAAEIGRR